MSIPMSICLQASMDPQLEVWLIDLERYLDRLNGGQGPGFTAFGWLITRQLAFGYLAATLPAVNVLLAAR